MSEMVPEDWRVESVSECCEILDSQRIPLNSEERAKRPGDYPYFGANGIQGFVDDYIFDGDAILVAEDGGNFDQYADRPIAQWVTGRFWVNNHAHIIRATGNNFNKWVYYSLVHKNILKYINGGTRAKLNQSDLKEINIPLPPLQEQKKIASILTSVDEVIENTQKQIDKLQDLKKATMNELLTKGIGHTEFKDSELGRIPKSWEVVSIETLSDRIIDYRGKSPPKAPVGIPLITAKNIRMGFIDENPREYIAEHSFDTWMVRGIPKLGDIFFTTEAPLGFVALVPEYKHAIGQRVITISPKSMTVLSNFLCYFMQGRVFQKQIIDASTGSTVTGVKQSTLRNALALVPPLSEQEEISNIIASLDSKTQRVTAKLSQVQFLKKSLMQNLLTGKTRVKVK